MESWNLNISQGYPSRARILEYPRVNSTALNRLDLAYAFMDVERSRNHVLYTHTHTHTQRLFPLKTNRFFLPDPRLRSAFLPSFLPPPPRLSDLAAVHHRMIVDYAPTTRIPKNFSAISQRALLDNSTSLVTVFSPLWLPFNFSFDTNLIPSHACFFLSLFFFFQK